jgi:hypothetical protein
MVWMVRKHYAQVNANTPAGVIITLHPTEALALQHMRECYLPQLEGRESFYTWEKMEHIDMANNRDMWIVQTDWHKDDEDLDYDDQYYQTPPYGVQGKNIGAFLDAAHEWAHADCVKETDPNTGKEVCDEGCVVERSHLFIRPANDCVWAPGTPIKW